MLNAEITLPLAEAIAWCARYARADDAHASTRSEMLCPPVMSLPRQKVLDTLLQAPGAAKAAVEFVTQARRMELVRRQIPIVPVDQHLGGGRILTTTLDTDSCEAATEVSNGFYDLDDLPGWDTWFWHERTDCPWGAIYCWVPSHLIELAQRGMDVIPVLCVEWAKSLE